MAFVDTLAARPALPRVVPFSIYIFFLAVGVLLIATGQYAHWDTRWLYGLKAACVALAIGFYWRNYTELHDDEPLSAGNWLLAVGVGLLVFVLWINLDQSWATIGTPESFDATRPDGKIDVPLAAIRWMGAALVVPVMEELFWRSFLLRWIQRQDFWRIQPGQITLPTSLITAALFAAEHNFWFAGLLAGLAYNWLYIRTGKLWVPIVAHAVTNGVLGMWVLETGNWQFW
jgi:CAAX prenyl protease-like protein